MSCVLLFCLTLLCVAVCQSRVSFSWLMFFVCDSRVSCLAVCRIMTMADGGSEDRLMLRQWSCSYTCYKHWCSDVKTVCVLCDQFRRQTTVPDTATFHVTATVCCCCCYSTPTPQPPYKPSTRCGVELESYFKRGLELTGGSRIELIETTDSVHLCYKFFIACQLCSAPVCPSVCLSHCGDNLNKTSLQSCDFHQTIVQNCSFWRWKDVAEIRRISPLATVFHRYPHSGIGENGYLQRLVEAIIRMTSSHFG